VPPRYWTSRGLDLLWQGIGRYLTAHPQIRYIFGAVSIANELPELAKQQIVARYQYHFQPVDWQDYAQAHGPFVCDRAIFESQRGRSFKSNEKRLQGYLRKQGVKLPPLYKHYADVCDEQGVIFVDFSIDSDFLLLH